MKTILEYLLSKKNKTAISAEYYVVWASFDIFQALDDKYPGKEFYDKDLVSYWILTGEEIVNVLKNISEVKILKQFVAYCVPPGHDEKSIKEQIETGKILVDSLKAITYEQIYYNETFK